MQSVLLDGKQVLFMASCQIYGPEWSRHKTPIVSIPLVHPVVFHAVFTFIAQRAMRKIHWELLLCTCLTHFSGACVEDICGRLSPLQSERGQRKVPFKTEYSYIHPVSSLLIFFCSQLPTHKTMSCVLLLCFAKGSCDRPFLDTEGTHSTSLLNMENLHGFVI